MQTRNSLKKLESIAKNVSKKVVKKKKPIPSIVVRESGNNAAKVERVAYRKNRIDDQKVYTEDGILYPSQKAIPLSCSKKYPVNCKLKRNMFKILVSQCRYSNSDGCKLKRYKLDKIRNIIKYTKNEKKIKKELDDEKTVSDNGD